MISFSAIGGRTPVNFHKGKKLFPTVAALGLKQWVLTNNRVSFTFIEDPGVGVYLYSWKTSETGTTINRSKNLWTIGMLSSYFVADDSSEFNEAYVVHPKAQYFQSPSQIPETIEEDKQFVFTWSAIPHDVLQPTFTIDVTLTATLNNALDTLDLAVRVEANQIYSNKDLLPGGSSVLNYIGYPTICLKKPATEAENKETIFSSPVSFGYTYRNPHKYLRQPRFNGESFQANENATRAFAAGQVGFPFVSLYKYNFGSPGWMTIPAMVYGNNDTQEGTLFYALDQEGTNPKGFQFYCDDENLFIKCSHTSDEAKDPYGAGGYYQDGITYNLVNEPTWTYRIKPFKSPTRWVDWYGFSLYRDDAIPLQEDFGWMPKSFYERYQAGEISKEAAELPMIHNTFGFTTGTFDSIVDSAELYKTIYRESVNPTYSGNPIVPVHYQTVKLNSGPQRSTDTGSPSLSAYFGWDPWSTGSVTPTTVGPDVFLSPDYTGVNYNHTGAYDSLVRNGNLLYAYNIFPYVISSGSVWTSEYDATDLVVKTLGTEDQYFTSGDYSSWARFGSAAQIFDSSFSACQAVDLNLDKQRDIASTLGSFGSNAYHDTAGVYGRGCVAKTHQHRDEDGNPVTVSHPRSRFSRYYNAKQVEWMDTWTQASASGYAQTYEGVTTAITSGDFALGQASEFPCDLNLKNIPISLLYEPLGPIFNFYLNDIDNPRSDALLNFHQGTIIDDQDDVTLGLLYAAGVRSWSTRVHPPNWIQRCPAYQIAFSDRCVTNEWTAIYSSNAMPGFYLRTTPTGVGTYGQLQKGDYTETGQRMDWASFTATQWPYSNRMSTWHVSPQYHFISPGYGGSGLPEDDAEVLYSGVWSGYTTNLTQKLFRLQAYLPDYMYHGDFLYPLDNYQVEHNAEAFSTIQSFKCMHPNLYPADEPLRGDEKVVHFLRRQNNSNNVVLVAGNWFSGNADFTGVFDPASYGITDSYQVYSLDVNTSNHGTKTLVTTKSAGETYTVDRTLAEFDYAVYEFQVNTFDLNSALFSDLKTDYTPVRYSYGVEAVTSNDLSFAYSYGADSSEIIEKQEGFKAPATQDILNNLPLWTEARGNTGSNAWQLTNAWGMALESVLESTEEHTYNLNLSTAPTHPLSSLTYSDIDQAKVLNRREKSNLLYNSSFSVRDVARTNMPAGWQDFSFINSTSVNYTSSPVSVGTLHATDGRLRVGQELIIDNAMAGRMYASVYLLCDASEVNVRLTVSVEKTDGTSLSAQAVQTTRSPEWIRLVLPIDINSQVYRVSYSVAADCSDAVCISAPQLESDALTAWNGSELDSLPHTPNSSRFNVVYSLPTSDNSKRHPIFPIQDEEDFIHAGIPTRIEKSSRPYREIAEVSSAAFGRRVDPQGETVRTEFVAIDNKIVERAISPTPFDIYGRYSVKDLRFHETLQYGTRDEASLSLELITTAVRDKVLYVLCKETFKGEARYLIKLVYPRVPPNGEDYLESFADFDLNLKFNKTFVTDGQLDEAPAALSFSDVDPSLMIVTTTNNIKKYYRMYFDYYYFNSQKNRLYTIETYDNAQISVI